jgi:GTPase SAR1 family protein
LREYADSVPFSTDYYRKAAGVVLVYDVNNLESFQSKITSPFKLKWQPFIMIASCHFCGISLPLALLDIGEWIELLNQHTEEGITRLLVGNKVDKAEGKKRTKVVSTEMGAALAKKHNIKFIELSAKTDKGAL